MRCDAIVVGARLLGLQIARRLAEVGHIPNFHDDAMTEVASPPRA